MIDVPLVLSLIASLYLSIAIVVAASRKPAYSHVRQTISELAEYGSEFAIQVSIGVFLPVAVALGVVALLSGSTNLPIAALALSIGIGYGLGAMFPCDPGSPITGSLRQGIHNFGGAVEYFGGAFSLLWISETAGPIFGITGLLVAAAAILLSFKSPLRGVIQRVAESGQLGTESTESAWNSQC